jgi:hypothetical protein
MLDKEVSLIAIFRINDARYSIWYTLDRIYLGEYPAATPYTEPLSYQTERKKDAWECERSRFFFGEK